MTIILLSPTALKLLSAGGESPVNEIIKTLKSLEKAGAQIIAMPCISAHYYFDEIASSTKLPVINMIEETYKVYAKVIPEKKVGLLATTGTVTSGKFSSSFPEKNVIIPDEMSQKNLVMEAIYGQKGIKVGQIAHPRKLLIEAAEKLINQGAEAIIAGCTEVSIALKNEDIPVHYLDPIIILAETAIRKAGYQVK